MEQRVVGWWTKSAVSGRLQTGGIYDSYLHIVLTSFVFIQKEGGRKDKYFLIGQKHEKTFTVLVELVTAFKTVKLIDLQQLLFILE